MCCQPGHERLSNRAKAPFFGLYETHVPQIYFITNKLVYLKFGIKIGGGDLDTWRQTQSGMPSELCKQFTAPPLVCSFSTMSKYPDYLTPSATPTKLGKGQKSRARREPSGVFSLFQAPQIQQFKEAFQLIDHDKDGWVNESDLKEIFASLGK